MSFIIWRIIFLWEEALLFSFLLSFFVALLIWAQFVRGKVKVGDAAWPIKESSLFNNVFETSLQGLLNLSIWSSCHIDRLLIVGKHLQRIQIGDILVHLIRRKHEKFDSILSQFFHQQSLSIICVIFHAHHSDELQIWSQWKEHIGIFLANFAVSTLAFIENSTQLYCVLSINLGLCNSNWMDALFWAPFDVLFNVWTLAFLQKSGQSS